MKIDEVKSTVKTQRISAHSHVKVCLNFQPYFLIIIFFKEISLQMIRNVYILMVYFCGPIKILYGLGYNFFKKGSI